MIAVLLVVLALVVAAIGIRIFLTEDSNAREVGADGARFMVGDIEVFVPPGAVPEGTAVSATQLEAAPPDSVAGINDFKAVGPGLDLRFEGDLQPKKPIEVTFPGPSETAVVALVLQHENQESEFVAATQNSGRITGSVPHLSGIWPVFFDAEKIFRDATTWLVQSLGLAQPEPSCTRNQPTINGIKFVVSQPAESWLCASERDGDLEVEVFSNSVQPFIVAARPTPTSTAPRTNIDVTTALLAVIANRMQQSGRSVVANDVSTRLVFDPRPDGDITLGFAQAPDLLYGQILLTAASQITGGFGSKALARLDDLKCLSTVVDVTRAELTVDQAVAFTRAFFDCLGPLLGELPGPHRVVLAAVFAVPQLFVGSVLGLIRELTGRGRYTTTITAIPTAASNPGVPPALRGTWCTKDGTECVNFAELLADNPNGFINDPSPHGDGSTQYSFCFENDLGEVLGEPACTTASSAYFDYFPAGVGWDCETSGRTTHEECYPDYTDAHDVRVPRLVHPPNHQQDDVYLDSPPMYRQ